MKNCIVHKCTNNSDQGAFVGDLCAPCHNYLTTGKIGYTKSFLGDLRPKDKPAESTPISTPEGKAQFITLHTNRLRDVAIERIPAMPDTWDGHEIRLYMSQLFADEVTIHMSQPKRRREFQNTIATSSGL